MTTQKAVGLRLTSLMVSKNMTPYALAKKSAITDSTLRSILAEEYKTVKLDTIILLCDGLGVTLAEFFNDDIFDRKNFDF